MSGVGLPIFCAFLQRQRLISFRGCDGTAIAIYFLFDSGILHEQPECFIKLISNNNIRRTLILKTFKILAKF